MDVVAAIGKQKGLSQCLLEQPLFLLAGTTGFEPAISALTGPHVNRYTTPPARIILTQWLMQSRHFSEIGRYRINRNDLLVLCILIGEGRPAAAPQPGRSVINRSLYPGLDG